MKRPRDHRRTPTVAVPGEIAADVYRIGSFPITGWRRLDSNRGKFAVLLKRRAIFRRRRSRYHGLHAASCYRSLCRMLPSSVNFNQRGSVSRKRPVFQLPSVRSSVCRAHVDLTRSACVRIQPVHG